MTYLCYDVGYLLCTFHSHDRLQIQNIAFHPHVFSSMANKKILKSNITLKMLLSGNGLNYALTFLCEVLN